MCEIINNKIDASMATRNAGLLNFNGLIPAAFITRSSWSFWSLKYEIMHPAKIPNGMTINNQLGKLYAERIKKSDNPAPLLTINFMLLKDWLNHIIPTKTSVEMKTLLNVCLKIYQVKII